MEKLSVKITATGGICQISLLNFRCPCASNKHTDTVTLMAHRFECSYKKLISVCADTAVAALPTVLSSNKCRPA
jgi:hypothetical protein